MRSPHPYSPKGLDSSMKPLVELTNRLERKYCQIVEEQKVRKNRAYNKSAIGLYSYTLQKYKKITKNSVFIWFLCCSEIVAALCVFTSVAWTAVKNLAVYGFPTPVYGLFFLTVFLMQLAVYTFIAAKAMGKIEVENKSGLDYQKMRLIEIKLFRSPFMPDLKNKKQEIRRSGQYMEFYTIEKWVNQEIKRACSAPERLDRRIILSEYVPTELKAQVLFVLLGGEDDKASSIEGGRARRALLYKAYSDLYECITNDSGFICDLYQYIEDKNTKEFHARILKKIGTLTKNREKKYESYMVSCCMHRFARFAISYIKNLEQELNREYYENEHTACDQKALKRPFWRHVGSKIYQMMVDMVKDNTSSNTWYSSDGSTKSALKKKAFEWMLKQHIKRQCKKLSNTYHEGWFRKLSIESLCSLIATFPGGLATLALSPVSGIVRMAGDRLRGTICTVFCIFTGVNYVLHNRRDMHKVWQNLCMFIEKLFAGVLSKGGLVEKHTWEIRWDHIWRGIMSVMMALAQSIFSYVAAKSFMLNPARVGAEQIHKMLFTLAPWLAPYFIPLCCVLTFCGTCLGCAHTTKYLSIGHSPAVKKNASKRSLLLYVLNRNFDFSKRPAYKGLKLFTTIAAAAQTMVIFISNTGVLGFFPALLLIPAVFITYAIIFRKLVDQVFDLRYKVRCEEKSTTPVVKETSLERVDEKESTEDFDFYLKTSRRAVCFAEDPREMEGKEAFDDDRIMAFKEKMKASRRSSHNQENADRRGEVGVVSMSRVYSSSSSIGTDGARSPDQSPADRHALINQGGDQQLLSTICQQMISERIKATLADLIKQDVQINTSQAIFRESTQFSQMKESQVSRSFYVNVSDDCKSCVTSDSLEDPRVKGLRMYGQ